MRTPVHEDTSMSEKNHNQYSSIVTSRIARKPSGEGLSLEFILGIDVVDIPDGKEVSYSLTQGKDGVITLTPEG